MKKTNELNTNRLYNAPYDHEQSYVVPCNHTGGGIRQVVQEDFERIWISNSDVGEMEYVFSQEVDLFGQTYLRFTLKNKSATIYQQSDDRIKLEHNSDAYQIYNSSYGPTTYKLGELVIKD